jgi:hypothetical protein
MIFKNLVLQALGTIRFRFLQKSLKKIVMLVYLEENKDEKQSKTEQDG